jgi:hypothetical protein
VIVSPGRARLRCEMKVSNDMISGKRIVVVLRAYNAERTLESTYREIPHDIVDHVVLVDDYSQDPP